MTKSMTGYAKVTESVQNKKITVEIKSLNAKSFNLMIKMPDSFNDKEAEIKNLLSSKMAGGKVNLSISIVDDNPKTATINENLLDAYIQKLKTISERNNLDVTKENILSTALKMPDVMINEDAISDSEEWEAIRKTIMSAVDMHDTFRIQEGKALEKDITEKIRLIETLMDNITPFEEERIIHVKNRIKTKLTEFLNASEQNNDRYEQEIIFYLEKLDINEEKVRLKNHCKYFMETLQSNEPTGSKLGFIAQEIGREINTIGSKANHSDIQKIVVNMKDALEKVKEQLFNVL